MYQHTKPRYTINDLLDLLGTGRASLYADINSGKLQTHKVGKRRFSGPMTLTSTLRCASKKAVNSNDPAP